MRRARTTIGAAACLLTLAADARAHLVSTELGPFYDGAAHALVTPGDLLAIVAIALLSALGGVDAARRAAVALIAAWCVGMLAGFLVPDAASISPATRAPLWAGVVLTLGALAALNVRPSAPVACVAAGAIGLFAGLANGAAAHADGVWLTTVGIAAGVGSIALLVAALGVWLDGKGWRVVLRVGGSWVAAISLLMLGWVYRGSLGA